MTSLNEVKVDRPVVASRLPLSLPRHYELAVLAGLLGLLVVSARALRFTVDDAYIAMRYARNLAEGRGLVYNAGEHVEGFTSPLWVLILAAARRLGFNIITASHVIGVALAVVTLILVYRMAARALPSNAVAGRLLPVLFLSTSWIFAGWATGGLETALYACVTVLGVSSLQGRMLRDSADGTDSTDRADGDWLPIVALLIVLTRPDGLLLAGVLGLASLVLDVRAGRSIVRTIVRWTLLFGVPVLLVEAWRLSYYGKWLPNTFYVKVNKVEYIDRGWPFVVSFAKDSLFYLWGPVAFAALFVGDIVSASILAYTVMYVAYTIWVGGDWMGYRFYSHVLALLCFPIATVLAGGTGRQRSTPLRAGLALAASVVMVVVIGATAYKTYAEGRETKMTMRELDTYKDMDTPESWATEVGWGLNTILHPGEAASATFAGFTAMYTDRTVVDALGLTDAYVASLPAIRGGPGHEKIAPREYLASRNVLMVNPWPMSDPANAHGRFRVQFAPGFYLNFDALVPPARVAAIMLPRGFNLWVGERQVFDRASVSDASPSFDFEDGTWNGWTLAGTAFGKAPSEGATWSNAPKVTGIEGSGFVNSFAGNSDAATGSARSPGFVIDGDVIHFLIAGGASASTALELWVDGARVRTTSGENSEDLIPLAWDVMPFQGRTGNLVIRDEESGAWGHIVVDDIHVARRKRVATN